MHIVFADDFDGLSIDSSKWTVQEGLNRGGIYRRNNTFVENGALVMRTVAENYTHAGLPYWVSSGAVSTSGKFSQRLGRWEASVKLPRPNESPSYTLHSSIWLNSGYVPVTSFLFQHPVAHLFFHRAKRRHHNRTTLLTPT